jgi:Bacterial SH3 domain
MAGLALPKLRWLIAGAIVAGVWVMREDMKRPRPPESVPSSAQRSPSAKPRPSKPVTAKATRPAAKQSAAPKTASERPVPPEPLTGKPAAQTAALQSVIVLPDRVERPPARPQKIVTGSITRPDKPTFVHTTSKVRVRAQARADSAIIGTLEAHTVVRELVRAGEWRLVLGDGRKGWVRADYLGKSPFSPRRPKLPVTAVRQARSK